MSAECKGVCCRGYEVYNAGFGSPRYVEGVKYCRTCGRYMALEANRCPCCKQRVSAKSRRYKKKSVSQVC
jgi:hypothetical protein